MRARDRCGLELCPPGKSPFALAGITSKTPDPTDGRFYYEDGELTGLVAEHARDPLWRFVPSGSTRTQRQEGVRLISKPMAASGLGLSARDRRGTDQLIAYQNAYASDELSFRMYLFPSGSGKLFASLKESGVRTGFGDEWLRIGAVRYGADGSASERTMRSIDPGRRILATMEPQR